MEIEGTIYGLYKLSIQPMTSNFRMEVGGLGYEFLSEVFSTDDKHINWTLNVLPLFGPDELKSLTLSKD